MKIKNNLAIKRQRGVALIQVLITTAIIMLLMVFFLTSARSQVDRARALQDKTQAYLSYHSTNNAVLFRLLTSDLQQLTKEGWNFHGEPFESNADAMVEIQDLNGLLSLGATVSPEMIEALLAEHISPDEAKTAAHRLMDWMDKDNIAHPYGAEQEHYAGTGIVVRNNYLQSFTELAYLDISYEAELALIENTTIHPTLYFNPLVASKPMLAAYLDNPAMAQQIANARQQSDFNKSTVEYITDLSAEDGFDYIYGPYFRVTINSKVGSSFYGKVQEFRIEPYKRRPLSVIARLPRQQRTR